MPGMHRETKGKVMILSLYRKIEKWGKEVDNKRPLPPEPADFNSQQEFCKARFGYQTKRFLVDLVGFINFTLHVVGPFFLFLWLAIQYQSLIWLFGLTLVYGLMCVDMSYQECKEKWEER